MKRACRATDVPRGARIESDNGFKGCIIQDVKIRYDMGVMYVDIKTSDGQKMSCRGFDIIDIDENTPERIARLAFARRVLGLGA